MLHSVVVIAVRLSHGKTLGDSMYLSADASRIKAALAGRDPAPPLAPQTPWRSDLAAELTEADDGDLLASTPRNAAMARAVRSGLLLWNDTLDTAHQLAMSEGVDDEPARVTLDYWHGLMHRREPDYPNSKYWFRRVGEHPAFPAVLTAARLVVDERGGSADDPARRLISGASAWDPFAFADLCEEHETTAGPTNEFLRAVQVAEIVVLLEYSAREAAGAAVEL